MDPIPYVTMCEHDICHCMHKHTFDSKSCRCTVLSAYARACARTGHPVKGDPPWRADFGCEVPCEGGKEWQECGNAACEVTCKMLSSDVMGTCNAVDIRSQ